MKHPLVFVFVIVVSSISGVFSCNAKQFNSGTTAPKTSFLQSLQDAGKQKTENNAQVKNKDPNTVVLYGKAQDHTKTFFQHPYRNDGSKGETGKEFDLFSSDLQNGYKSGSGYQFGTGNEIKSEYGSGANLLFQTPLANDYKKGPGYQINDNGKNKENDPVAKFKNSFGKDFNNGNSFPIVDHDNFSGENGRNQFGNNGDKIPVAFSNNYNENNNNNKKGLTGFSNIFNGNKNNDNTNKGLTGFSNTYTVNVNNNDNNKATLFPIQLPTQLVPEQGKEIEFLPKPEAQKQTLLQNNHATGNIKEIAGQLNFKPFDLYNNPGFEIGDNNLDFNDNTGYNNYNNELNANLQNIHPSHTQQNTNDGSLTSGFYNINEPSGSWRSVDYNAGPTGFFANVQQATNHDTKNGQATSYGHFKTFGTNQNFGF